jgi:endonuclease/exonuclease/phosphatase family metal-dependent hydrolase
MAGPGDHRPRRAGVSLVQALVVALWAAGCVQRLPLPTLSSGDSVRLAVITWNMHAGRGDLATLVDDLASSRLTSAPVRDYVLLLQEATVQGEGDVRAFARSRGLHAFVVPVRTRRGRDSGNAIVSTLPLNNTRLIELPRERQLRTAAAATIDIDRQPLVVSSAHMENRASVFRGLVFSDGARRRQAEALVRALPDGPAILGGDFNALLGRREPVLRILAERFDDTPVEPLAPTFRRRLALDHIFFDVPEGWLVSRMVLGRTYGSDHNPVLGIVSVRAITTSSPASRPEPFARSPRTSP